MTLKKIPLKKAIGSRLAHDITEICPGIFKGPAFRKGHIVREQDLCRLQRLGKNHLCVLELGCDEFHEDEAAAILAESLAGEGIVWEEEPKEGKIKLVASWNGLFTVDVKTLAAFNTIDEVMCATLHNSTMVKQGELVAATRAIPLVLKSSTIERVLAICRQNGPPLSVRVLRQAKVGLVITGNEVYHGLVEDRFAPILTEKIMALGSEVAAVTFVQDNAEIIGCIIRAQLAQGCDLILLSGGMSVDPDDVTRHGIQLAGASEIHYGAAALPGAMFLVAYLGKVPLLGVPACALHHRTTVLDLILPRILAGEHIGKKQLATLGHGGLCRDCPECSYPHCPFGKRA